MKKHTARWRKGEEILTKLLKEGKDTGGCHRRSMEERGKKKEGGGNIMIMNNSLL